MSVFDDANNVAFWDFNELVGGVVQNKLNPGTRDITLTGAVINTVDPMVGTGDVFGDGVDDYGVAANSADFNITATDPFGMSYFHNTITSATTIMISKFDGTNGFNFQNFSGRPRFLLQGNGGLILVRALAPVPIGKYHVLWNYDGSTNASGVKLYINGIRVAFTIQLDNLTTGGSNSADFELFRNRIPQYFTSKVDAILPRIGSQFTDGGVAIGELAGGEVEELWNGGAGLEVLAATHQYGAATVVKSPDRIGRAVKSPDRIAHVIRPPSTPYKIIKR